jgi:DNA-directed RNA polymerase alpha subunit
MTDLFKEEHRQNRHAGAGLIAQELRQFKRLQHLSDYDVAFRMASSVNEVRKLRKQYNQLTRPLYDTSIDYAVRVILGQRGVKTTGDLFALSDRDLLAIPQIGEARLEHIRQALKDYFG